MLGLTHRRVWALRSTVSLLVAAWLAAGCPSVRAQTALPDYASQVYILLNQFRAQNSVPLLRRVVPLDAAAQTYANLMAATGHYSHTGPDGSSPADRMATAGYAWTLWGENIAFGQDTPNEVMAAWINSPSHRDNMLNGNFRDVGIGAARAADGTIYWVQDFGASSQTYPLSQDMTLPGDTTPPVITAVRVSGVTSSAATVSWATNEPADSQVEYGTTAAYGSSSPLDPTLTTTHTVTLSSLSAATTYYCRVKSRDAAGNLAVTSDFIITTVAAPDTTPPVITAVAAGGIGTTSVTITWTTDEPSDSQVEYGPTAAYGAATTLSTARVTSHSVPISGLKASTTYHYRVKSKDAASNLAVSGDYTFTTASPPDTKAPVLSAVSCTNVTSCSATISWTTDEPSDGVVMYGLGPGYGQTATSAEFTTNHVVTLTGLTPNTLYHYAVRSRDPSGNVSTSGDAMFATLREPDTTPPSIRDLSVVGRSPTSVSVSWTTDEPADGQVEYGPTEEYGSSTPLDTLRGVSHTFVLSGLQPATLYHYRVRSSDAAGNQAISADGTFTTPLPRGDINGDGRVTIVDAVLVLRFLAGLDTPSQAQLAAADLDANGKISVADALIVLKLVVGIAA